MLRFFKKTYSEEEKQLFDFLRKAALFNELTNEELERFQPYLYLRKYNESEVVFFTGDPSHALYIVKEGAVSLNIEFRDSFEELMALKSGNMFGENSVLAKTKRIYTSIVQSDETELYVIPKVNLLEIMDHHTTIKAKIMTAFAQQYNQYTSRLFDTYKGSRGFFDLNTVYS